ncbi:MAG: IS4 family transposase [bacterium]
MARSKLLPSAFLRVFHLFNRAFDCCRTYRGFHLIACDGTDVNIPYDPHDKGTSINGKTKSPYSQYHVHALYDCLNGIYRDIRITPRAEIGEVRSLEEMIRDRVYPARSVIICDRGYESYNLMATCIENGQKFLIRAKDIGSSTGIVNRFGFAGGTFDEVVHVRMTRKLSLRNKVDGIWHYSFLSTTSRFDYLAPGQDYYEISFRVVRIKIDDDTYETLLTSLTEDEMPSEDMKELYHFRWSEECAFRAVKYDIGMIYFHSIKRDLIRQEIYASFILYNLTALISSIHAETDVPENRKHKKKANFSLAVTNLREFLNGRISAAELAGRIKKNLVPVRPDRSYERNVKPQSLRPFNCRIS